MCPLTIAAVATAGAAAVSAVGAISAGNSAANADKYNATIETQNAAADRAAAAAQAGQQQTTNQRNLGQTLAAYGASGVDPNQGSPLAVMSDVATQGELSRQLILQQGELDARSAGQRSALDTASARSAQTAGYINAGSTLLSAGGRIAGNYAQSSGPGFPSSVTVTPRVTAPSGATY